MRGIIALARGDEAEVQRRAEAFEALDTQLGPALERYQHAVQQCEDDVPSVG